MQNFVLFDFDGVIVDSFDIALEVKQMACPHLTAEDYKKRFEGNINEFDLSKVKHTDQCRAVDFFTEYVPRMHRVQLFPGIKEILAQLAKDYALIIISSTISTPIKEHIERNGLQDYFAEIMGNDIHKSKVEKIKMIFQKYSTTPKHCVFITDTLGDLREAEKSGLGAIAVSWGFHSHETLQKGNPTKIIDSPTELTQTIDEYFKKSS